MADNTVATAQVAKLKVIAWAIAILAVVTIGFTGYLLTHPKQTQQEKELSIQLDNLQKSLDSAKHERPHLDTIIAVSERTVDRLNKMDSALAIYHLSFESKIQTVKKEYEKTNRIDTFSANSIKGYFADKFGK